MNYIEHFLILIYTVIGCISISDFALLVFIPITITISAKGLKPCVITARIKKFKSIIKKNKKKHYEVLLSAKSKLREGKNPKKL